MPSKKWQDRKTLNKVVPVDNPSEMEVAIHDRLVNWGRWCVTYTPRGRAMSLEGRYQPKAGNVYEGARLTIRVDEKDAVEINAAVRLLPQICRAAFALRYWKRLSDSTICRRIGLDPSYYSAFMSQSRISLARLLQNRKIITTIKPENLIPSTDEDTFLPAAGQSMAKGRKEECQAEALDHVPFQVVANLSREGAAVGIAKQTAPAVESAKPAQSRTSASSGDASGRSSLEQNRSVVTVRRKDA